MNQELPKYCSNASSREDFVGISFTWDDKVCLAKPQITFPYGYSLVNVDEKDVFLLVQTLSRFQKQVEDLGVLHTNSDKISGFPLKSYMVVIEDYLRNGYYHDRTVHYVSRTSGKVNWGRTIKKENPIIQDNDTVYLKMQTRVHQTNDDLLITQISKYCVYESLVKMGWYYGILTPPKPNTPFYEELFITTLQERLHKTNKDSDKLLFQSMLQVLQNVDQKSDQSQEFQFGTNRFEQVWELLIDKVYGTKTGENKKHYFPKATWYLHDQGQLLSNNLYPDTIMETTNGFLYVIDAKYYRYGETKEPTHLPEISSIAKQVVYAQYIAQKGNKLGISPNKIRNAFILPCDRLKFKNNSTHNYIGYADSALSVADDQEYTKIHTLLIDTKHLMHVAQKSSLDEIIKLSQLIEYHIEESYVSDACE
ncbi:TPA: LlaJI family restriction endonuclease [Pasteurella multocida]|nr:LlaJI family restriction endonuclease [Pasteurella multocida]